MAQGDRTLHEQLLCGVFSIFDTINLSGSGHLSASRKLICDFMKSHHKELSHEAHDGYSMKGIKDEVFWAYERFLEIQKNVRCGNLDPEKQLVKIIDRMIERDVHFLIRNPNRPVSARNDENPRVSDSLRRYQNSSFVVSYGGIGRSAGSQLLDWAVNHAMEIFVGEVDVEQRAKIQVVSNRHFSVQPQDRKLIRDRYKDLFSAN